MFIDFSHQGAGFFDKVSLVCQKQGEILNRTIRHTSVEKENYQVGSSFFLICLVLFLFWLIVKKYISFFTLLAKNSCSKKILLAKNKLICGKNFSRGHLCSKTRLIDPKIHQNLEIGKKLRFLFIIRLKSKIE